MPEKANELIYSAIIILAVICTCYIVFKVIYTHFKDRIAPIKTAKAQIVDKYISDSFSKIYGSAAKKPQYYIVFAMGSRKRSFRVSEFSYNGYKVKQRGTLKYKGTRLISFD